MSQFEAPVPTPRDEPVWLQPFPDALLEGAAGRPLGPEARYEQTEAISLAFVTALQLLPRSSGKRCSDLADPDVVLALPGERAAVLVLVALPQPLPG
jgi:hypothetical protein